MASSRTASANTVTRPQIRQPVVRALLADLDTPLSVYLKLANRPYSYLLESVQGGEQWGRYSIIGLACSERIRIRGEQIFIERDGQADEVHQAANPLNWVAQYAAGFDSSHPAGMPRLTGGFVGYFGYDCVRYVEPRLGAANQNDPLKTPDVLLMRSEELVVFDNLAGKLYLIVHVDASADEAARAQARLDELQAQLQQPLPTLPALNLNADSATQFVSGFGQDEFEAGVERIKEYIRAGDCMQVVLSQRLSAPFEGEPLNLYRALRTLNPSPYLYYLHLDDHQVVGSSPEILVRVEDEDITVRPIAGTRPRGKTPEEDLALETELLADPKERAEHLMLIDLGRNDVGRVANAGSVELTDKMVIERYSHVMHIVSNVMGKLKPSMTAMDALQAVLPAGTLSGAPKVRAMEIIDELEPVKRCVYGGAVGYLAYNGTMDTAIAIRTALVKDGQVHVQAGGGIVADSLPRNEWEESMNKARAVLRAAAMAAGGAD